MNLTQVDTYPLCLECDESRDVVWSNDEKNLEVFIRAINNSREKTIDDVTISVQVEVIDSDNIKKANNIVGLINGNTLKLKTDVLNNDPVEFHTLNPKEHLEFYLVKAEQSAGSFLVFAQGTESVILRTISPDLISLDVYTRSRSSDASLDAGTYQINVALRGRDMQTQKLSFEITCEGQTLSFQNVPPTDTD